MTTTNNLSSTQKEFDCLVFKQKAQTQIYQDINTLDSQKLVDYFHEASHAGTLGDWWKTITR